MVNRSNYTARILVWCAVLLVFALVINLFLLNTMTNKYQVIKIVKYNIPNNLNSYLKTYDASDQHGGIRLIRIGSLYDGGYVVPVQALQKANVMFSYGIADDYHFEKTIAEKYKKPVYGFDCGLASSKAITSNFQLINECIGTDKFLYQTQKSSKKISSFIDELKAFKLENKKIFIKMDIEGAEFDVLPEILTFNKQVMGMVIEFHLLNGYTLYDLQKILEQVEKNFILLHLHGNNNASFILTKNRNIVPMVMEFTFINKNIVNHYAVSKNQSHPSFSDRPNNPKKRDIYFTVDA